MSTVKQKPIFPLSPSIDTLKMFICALNCDFCTVPVRVKGGWGILSGDYRPVNRELRRLVQAWFASGPNVSKLLSEDPVLSQLSRVVRAFLLPTKGGRAHLVYIDGPENTGLVPGDPIEIALGLFFLFLLNPYNEKLGGPCKHCGKYYLKKTKRQVVYCSKRCGLKNTSQAVIREQRRQEHQEILEKAKHFSGKWTKANTHKGWKDWVSGNAMISKNWLTRAVKNGELAEPVKHSDRSSPRYSRPLRH